MKVKAPLFVVPVDFSPEMEVTVGNPEPTLNDVVLSAVRPPHPVWLGWPAIEVCHCATWSEWEKSWYGLGFKLDLYAVRFGSGTTSGPTLHTTPSRC